MSTNTALKDLEAVRDKRGYLLPHHGLLALSAPNLLQHYDQLYSSLTLTDRHLDRHDHEFVWLGVLMSTQEALVHTTCSASSTQGVPLMKLVA